MWMVKSHHDTIKYNFWFHDNCKNDISNLEWRYFRKHRFMLIFLPSIGMSHWFRKRDSFWCSATFLWFVFLGFSMWNTWCYLLIACAAYSLWVTAFVFWISMLFSCYCFWSIFSQFQVLRAASKRNLQGLLLYCRLSVRLRYNVLLLSVDYLK